MTLKGSKEALTGLIVTHVLMSKGLKVVFVAYVHNIDTFNTMSKGLKGSKDYVMYTIQIHSMLCQKGRKIIIC